MDPDTFEETMELETKKFVDDFFSMSREERNRILYDSSVVDPTNEGKYALLRAVTQDPRFLLPLRDEKKSSPKAAQSPVSSPEAAQSPVPEAAQSPVPKAAQSPVPEAAQSLVSSFETSQGSVYTYGADGKVLRQKSVAGSTMDASISMFDRTAFLPEADFKAARMGLERGLRPTESGQFRGLDYDDSKMDQQKFMDLRFKGKKSFDEAFTGAGGTISERLITPETQPRLGLNPLEYNLGNARVHAGNKITKITMKDGSITEYDFDRKNSN
jgi:hypothetical protein